MDFFEEDLVRLDDDSNHDSAKEIFGRIFFSFFSPLTEKSIFILSCIAVSLDPLFFYIPIIDEKNKCLGIDKNLRTAALIFRALPDATLALRTIISGYKIYTDEDEDGDWLVTLFVGILVVVSFILPIPQLAIVVFFFKPGGSGHFGQRVTVNVFLIIYYLARVFIIYNFSTDDMYHARKWVRATLYLFFYIVASHVFGGFWYFFSIQQEISCWYKYCESTKACSATYYCSDSTSRNTTFINELCPTNPPNATALNFGIFFDAVESRITRSTHFTAKFLYCMWWGVRNMSNFGTNLVTSTYEWENCFAIVISISGMLLFLYLLGNLQIHLQHAATQLLVDEKKADDVRRKIRTWMETNDVPHYTVKLIQRKLVKNIDAEVDVNFICSVVADHPRAIIQHICMEKLKIVNKLQDLKDSTLVTICSYLKPKIFQDNTKIFEAGQPLNSMIYIVSGSVMAYPPSTNPATTETLEKGVFVGEQLLDWATRTNQTFTDQPRSEKTVQCSTKVEAFVLSFEDLKTLASKGILTKNSTSEAAHASLLINQ